MNKARHNKIKIFLFAIFLALVPVFSFAQSTTATAPTTTAVPQGFSGIFTCNQNGANAMSVGALGATGGVYVPVADATVELNTGTLVYKECILREVVDAQRQAATAGFVQQGTNQILTGRNGSPQYVVQVLQEITNIGTNNGVVAFLQNGTSSLDPNIAAQVKSAVAQGYAIATYNAPSMLTCPYAGATTDFTGGNTQGNIWNDVLAVASPCNPILGYEDANDLALGAAQAEENCQLEQWQWGGGFYSVTSGTGGPCEQQITTPSSDVNGVYSQLLQSPFNQLQNANDLGQMVGALFGGISTQVLSSTVGSASGISGLVQPVGNQPSYLQQAVNEETQNLQTSLANTALVNLQAALAIEQAYYKSMSDIATSLEGAISQLRTAEATCYEDVEQKLCPGGVHANGSCTDVNGNQLKVVTSTEFSQPVINSQIAALATTTANNLQVSQQALNLINQLIQNVSGSSADAQAVAIEQLQQLTANNELHTQAQLSTAQAQEQSVISAMTTLEQNTPELWAGTDPNNTSSTNIPWNGTVGATITASDPGVGWCNFGNATTIQQWEQTWQQ